MTDEKLTLTTDVPEPCLSLATAWSLTEVTPEFRAWDWSMITMKDSHWLIVATNQLPTLDSSKGNSAAAWSLVALACHRHLGRNSIGV